MYAFPTFMGTCNCLCTLNPIKSLPHLDQKCLCIPNLHPSAKSPCAPQHDHIAGTSPSKHRRNLSFPLAKTPNPFSQCPWPRLALGWRCTQDDPPAFRRACLANCCNCFRSLPFHFLASAGMKVPGWWQHPIGILRASLGENFSPHREHNFKRCDASDN